jgi:hypothetical protein
MLVILDLEPTLDRQAIKQLLDLFGEKVTERIVTPFPFPVIDLCLFVMGEFANPERGIGDDIGEKKALWVVMLGQLLKEVFVGTFLELRNLDFHTTIVLEEIVGRFGEVIFEGEI